MTLDSRFVPPSATHRHCLSCNHHRMPDNAIECHHPQRPEGTREVIRWYSGCPQHVPLKETNQ